MAFQRHLGKVGRLFPFSADLAARDSAGPSVLNEAVSVTNPVFCPDKADKTTGIGGADGGGNIALIAGGVQSLTMNSDGSVSNTVQPSILVAPSGTLTDVTGDGTNYTVVFATEITDQGGDFDGTSTFTAPVSGNYLVAFNTDMTGLTGAADDISMAIVSSNRQVNTKLAYANYPATNLTASHSVVMDMDASDTITCTAQVTGESKVVDINANVHTFLSIALLS